MQALLARRRAVIDELLALDARILNALKYGDPINGQGIQRIKRALEVIDADGLSHAVVVQNKAGKRCVIHPVARATVAADARVPRRLSDVTRRAGEVIGSVTEGQAVLLQSGRRAERQDRAVLEPASPESELSEQIYRVRRLFADRVAVAADVRRYQRG